MSKEADSQPLQALKPIERFNFRVIRSLNNSKPLRRLLTRLGATLGRAWVELGTSKTVVDHGFENFQKIDPSRAVLLVANHRTFYDQFVITARLFRLYGPHHNIYFPVRAPFFYDSFWGLLVNLPVAMATMYPPIVRDKGRRQWNAYATEIMAELLKDPSNMIGFHPEGTRNRGPNPYDLLPPKPGCGELIHRSNPNVVPVFLQGFPRNFTKLIRRNLSLNSTPPYVHMVMGEPMEFSASLSLPPERKTYLQISREVMSSIAELSRREQQIRSES